MARNIDCIIETTKVEKVMDNSEECSPIGSSVLVTANRDEEANLIIAPRVTSAPQVNAVSCSIRIKVSPPVKKKKPHSYWIFSKISWILNIVLIAALGTVLLPKIYQEGEDRRGVIGISGTHVQWLKSCPRHRYSSYLSDLDVRIQDYGLVQLEDEVWLCGGYGDRDMDQIRTCLILSLVDGRWRTFEHKMIHPRMRPVMLVDQGAVIVMSGVTSHVNSNTGCRDTQEVRTSHN